MNNKGSMTLVTIVLFMAILPGIVFAASLGVSYYEQSGKLVSATQHAADSLAAHVISYNAAENRAVFSDSTQAEATASSIVLGNLGLAEFTEEDSFLGEEPSFQVHWYPDVPEGGLNVTHVGKTFFLPRPGGILVAEYQLKARLYETISPPEIIVVRSYILKEE